MLPKLMATITRHPREKQKIWWRKDSLVHNAFMLWKLLFWARKGIRFEMAVSVLPDGSVVRRYGTWEAFFFDMEEKIKSFELRIPIRIEIPLLRLPTGHTIPASPYLFAIVLDASAGVLNTTNPSTTITVGSSASNYFGFVNLMPTGTAGSTSSGTTWGGVSMTQIYDSIENINGTGAHHYALYKTSISAGSTTVSSTTSNNYYLDIVSFSGVDQSTPLDTNFDGAAASYKRATQVSGTSFSVTGTTHVDNSVGIGTILNDGVGVTPGTNTNSVRNETFYNAAAITPAGSCTLAGTAGSAPPNWLGISSAMQPASGGGAAVVYPMNMPILGVG